MDPAFMRKKRIYTKYFPAYTKEFGHYKDPGVGMCTVSKRNFRRWGMWVGVDWIHLDDLSIEFSGRLLGTVMKLAPP